MGFLKNWFSRCRECKGTGLVTTYRKADRAELTDAQYAEVLVNGGWYYEPVVKPCGACGGKAVRGS